MAPSVLDMHTLKRCKPMLGTYVEISLSSKGGDLVEISELAFDEITRIESLMSYYDADSEVSLLNREAYHRSCKVSDDLYAVLEFCQHVSQASLGLFDITVASKFARKERLPYLYTHTDPNASWQDIVLDNGCVSFRKPLLIELGGVAKGYAVDKAFERIHQQVDDVLVNAGGDMRRKCWQGQTVEVKQVWSNKKTLVDVSMQDAAMATSATYYLENMGGIMSPRTGGVVQDNRSLSVFAPTCMVADALTKIAFLARNPMEIIHQFGGLFYVSNQHAIKYGG